MLLHLFSDANYNLLGFNATYTFSLCPGACGGRGRCDLATSQCQCQPGWGGADCTTPLCSQACSAHGECDLVRDATGPCILLTSVRNNRQYSGGVPIPLRAALTKFWPSDSICQLVYEKCYINKVTLPCLVSCRTRRAVCVVRASLVRTASWVSAMRTRQASGGG